MKIDLKKILLYFIGACLLVSVFLNFKGFNREPFEKLEEKNRLLEKTRDSLRYANQNLKKKFDYIQMDINKRDAHIADLRIQIDAAKRDVADYKNRVDRVNKDLIETNKKLDNLRKNPIKREDDDLINSFKNKLKTP
jgi:septal ring factor EnvC (AmiA/AmiB activator)